MQFLFHVEFLMVKKFTLMKLKCLFSALCKLRFFILVSVIHFIVTWINQDFNLLDMNLIDSVFVLSFVLVVALKMDTASVLLDQLS